MKFELTEQETDIIYAALIKQPMEAVEGVVNSLRKQVYGQQQAASISAAQEAKEAPEENKTPRRGRPMKQETAPAPEADATPEDKPRRRRGRPPRAEAANPA